ncbi:MAG: stage III sporulation protein AB [Oscillospiraceae bacterium]|nr:stage III sporulation protein AB [Oscillospiraceae bacterium]
MLKLAGSALVLIAGFFVRRAVVSRLQASIETCRAMIAALSWMEAQVRMELVPVPRLLPRLSQRALVGDFFAAVARGLGRERTLFEAWAEALSMLPLCEEEREILHSLGERLDGEEESVCRALAGAVREMEGSYARKQRDYCERKRLYSALCLGACAFIIIVLL